MNYWWVKRSCGCHKKMEKWFCMLKNSKRKRQLYCWHKNTILSIFFSLKLIFTVDQTTLSSFNLIYTILLYLVFLCVSILPRYSFGWIMRTKCVIDFCFPSRHALSLHHILFVKNLANDIVHFATFCGYHHNIFVCLSATIILIETETHGIECWK